jgi:hypothetical protein
MGRHNVFMGLLGAAGSIDAFAVYAVLMSEGHLLRLGRV